MFVKLVFKELWN